MSSLTGYLAAGGEYASALWYMLGGVFLLAMGASALNQVQEYRYDLKMERTRNRPIPSGRLQPAQALFIALFLLVLGALILLTGCGQLSFLLGVMTIFWYNILYTYLKRVTAFAVVPGSMVGALPPLIGWSATGVEIGDSAIFLAAFFFIAQIPHFWLIILSIGSQYEAAGYPSLSAILSRKQIGRLTLVWIVATGLVALFLPLFGTLDHKVLTWLLVAGALWMIWGFLKMAGRSLDDVQPRKGFIRLNLFVLLVMVLIWVDAFLP
jgi:protoheme IX farnesyltransferase